MDVFILTLVFITGLILGTAEKDHASDPQDSVQAEPKPANIQSRACKPSVSVCDSDRYPIILRDLTLPVEQQVNDDDH